MGASIAMALGLVCLVGCSVDGDESASGALAPTQPPPTASATAADAPLPTPVISVAPTPHVGVIDVVELVQAPSSEVGLRVVAVHVRGAVGTSAIFRSIEIRAWAEAIDGSRCDAPPVPTVLHPTHDDAVRPSLADQTRTAVVRSLGPPRAAADARIVAHFRYGPVPSLNGDFDGWVSFHVPAGSADGFCAFDMRGVVIIVAGETTTAVLPALRIDTRDP